VNKPPTPSQRFRVISDGGQNFGLIKTGNGILDITATETYTGSTAVSNGTLRVNGSLNAASTVTVVTNATLGGNGTINAPSLCWRAAALLRAVPSAPSRSIIGLLWQAT